MVLARLLLGGLEPVGRRLFLELFALLALLFLALAVLVDQHVQPG